ncbi:MAG: ABC transporter ATP-binding protein [Candidatus Thermoplasmatota archaeon]|nr:ABC transporter ATP-binding protein [Candidatus Thermoplasmatota archaeon]
MVDNPVIQTSGLRKVYPGYASRVEALKNIDLTIKAGEYLTILGPSGSGKSTLLYVLGCLDRPTEGSLLVDGKKTNELTDAELSYLRGEKFGFVFQERNLLPTMTVLDNVMLPALIRSKGRSYAEIEQRARELIERVNLTHRVDHIAIHLSVGEQQRVAIARALINDPEVIFADEPTGSLDSASADNVMDIFTALYRRGITVVLVTHEESFTKYATRMIKLVDGSIVEERRL